MSRILFYVVPDQPGWRVVGEGAASEHPTKEAASRRALTFGRYQWEICGRASGVLIRRDDGQGYERHDFGVDADSTQVLKRGRG